MNDTGNCMNENVIEYFKGGKFATITAANSTKLNNRIRKYAESHPDECQIISDNADGSLLAHVPVSWIKVSPKRVVSEEAKERGRQVLNSYRESQR